MRCAQLIYNSFLVSLVHIFNCAYHHLCGCR
jgi:hypothetical protein